MTVNIGHVQPKGITMTKIRNENLFSFFYFSFITYVERNRENLTFYNRKSRNFGLIKATKSIIISGITESRK